LRRVLVTGGAGFTARYVTSALQLQGYDVRSLQRGECDVLDRWSVSNALVTHSPTFVIHLAGTSNLPDSESDRLFSLNVQGTRNLLDAASRIHPTPAKILVASSSFVYGDTGEKPAGEESPFAPQGAYGESKVEMERLASSWFGRLPIIIVRPFNYTGVGHGPQFLVPKLVQFSRDRGEDASFVDARTVRDYSDVRWIATVYAALLAHSESGFAVNVCSGVGTPLPQLVEMLEEMTGHRARVRPSSVDGQRHALVGSPERLQRLLGKLSPYPLRETLRWMLEAHGS
jgi:nucleoside-diphosphate-sugar epimerase